MFEDNISKKYIEEHIPKIYTIDIKKEVTSTNLLLKEYALGGGEEFSVLIANHQTMGRGRLGKSFHSPENTGIYMSVLLSSKKDSNPLLITVDAAVCLARVLEKITGESTSIKWVNDIYIKGKKVCGILAEAVQDKVVLGIGINVFSPKEGFPDDIKDRAGALFEKREKNVRENIISQILCEFYNIYTNPNREELFNEYKTRSIVIGKEILVLQNDCHKDATVLDVNEDYSLRIKTENGEIINLLSGDVSIKI